MDSKKNFFQIPAKLLNDIYDLSIELAKKHKPIVFGDFNINPVHLPSVGYWNSTEYIKNVLRTSYDLPYISNSILLPYYSIGDNDSITLSNIKIVTQNKFGKTSYKTLGPGNYGWFGLFTSAYMSKLSGAKSGNFSITITEQTLDALNSDSYIHSEFIGQSNIDQLARLTRKIYLKGSSDFVKKFGKIEGFDFSVGKNNLPINEFCITDFIFSELNGLSLNVAIKLSKDFVKKLSYQDRILFKEKFQSIFKFDLELQLPWLFERQGNESSILNEVEAFFRQSIVLEYSPTKNTVNIYVAASKNNQKPVIYENITFTKENIINFLILNYGDLYDFCSENFGIPVSFFHDRVGDCRARKVDVYDLVEDMFYKKFKALLLYKG